MSTSSPVPSFTDFAISPQLKESIAKAGFTTPTPIQAQAIPPALAGRDLIGSAQTGTGKTAAFVVPIVERLRGKRGLGALILTPTRELAMQIEEVFHQLARGQVRVTTVIGGASMSRQYQALKAQPNVVIATPGRLLDHLGQQTVDLRPLQVLVLDEADRMLDMGFAPQINRILAAVPKERQTMLFSATIPPEIAALSRAELRNPVRIEIARSGMTAEKVAQAVFRVPQTQKTSLLLWLLEEQTGPTIVFTRTKHRADRIARTLKERGFPVAVLHANRSLSQRMAALEGFKRGTFRVLVATDIAARGIDVVDIAHVVNYDLPHVAEDYVHRVGRTARAERSGHAWSFAGPDEQKQLRDIERLLRKSVPLIALPASLPAPVREMESPSRSSSFARPRPAQSGFRSPAASDSRRPSPRTDRPRFASPRRPDGADRGRRPDHRAPVSHAHAPRGGERTTDWTPPDSSDVFFIEKHERRPARGRTSGRSGAGSAKPWRSGASPAKPWRSGGGAPHRRGGPPNRRGGSPRSFGDRGPRR
ncbi:DEAD/DEAH box helicase [Candidatus Uhrbacteria bacterium]|nr:DEAD/DEAH box helicase [Candidatus Uhrbacteria bacterium]